MNTTTAFFQRAAAGFAAVALSTALFVGYFAMPAAHLTTGLVA